MSIEVPQFVQGLHPVALRASHPPAVRRVVPTVPTITFDSKSDDGECPATIDDSHVRWAM